MHRVVVMDQREPSVVARCSAELWGAAREGNRRDITLLFLCVYHIPVPQTALTLFIEIVHPSFDQSLCITLGNYLKDRKTL